jgi:hypothetical protein
MSGFHGINIDAIIGFLIIQFAPLPIFKRFDDIEVIFGEFSQFIGNCSSCV